MAVISHRLWQRHFQADPAVVGSLVRLSGAEFVIVGVAPGEGASSVPSPADAELKLHAMPRSC